MIMAVTIKTLDHIQLAAPKGSEEKAKAFFSDVLGFYEIDKPEELKKRGGVWFKLGSIQVHIGIEDPFIPAKKAHPAFEVECIDELKAHLTEQAIAWKDDHKLPGAKRIYVQDPFGNRLEFLQWIK